MLKKIPNIFIPIFTFLMPFSAFAESNNTCSANLKTVGDIFNFFICLINKSIIPLLFLVATVIFIYGIVKFLMNGDDETKREEGKSFMIWGIVSLFVMLSVWSLVGILKDTFAVSKFIPQLPTK